MSWSKCPICDGTGYELESDRKIGRCCLVCNGKKIINDTTGQPPKEV